MFLLSVLVASLAIKLDARTSELIGAMVAVPAFSSPEPGGEASRGREAAERCKGGKNAISLARLEQACAACACLFFSRRAVDYL